MVGRSFILKDASKDSLNPEGSYYGIRRGWLAVTVVFVVGFTIMGSTGKIIYDNAPPIPTFRLASEKTGELGQVLWSSED